MTSKVSGDFKKAMGKFTGAVQAAKGAENKLSNNPLPIGFSGQGLVTGLNFYVSKNGDPGCRVEFSIKDDPQFKGTKISRNFTFKETKGQDGSVKTVQDKIENFLDNLEIYGLPSDLRKEHGDDYDWLISWFTVDGSRVVNIECTKSNWAGSQDGKDLRIVKAADLVNTGNSMSPDENTTTTSSDGKERVSFLGATWEVISTGPEEGEIEITNPATGKTRKVMRNQLDA